jgi:MoaA/NifB/PqqE/SkfB family radical SAM enzyme
MPTAKLTAAPYWKRARSPEEAEKVMAFTNQMGFTARVLLVHDKHGQLKLNEQELRVFERTVKKLPKSWMDFSGYRKRLVRDGSSPCRSGRRYLHIDEFGRVHWCSQTPTVWSKPLMAIHA